MIEISTALNLVLVSIVILSFFVFYKIFDGIPNFSNLSTLDKFIGLVTFLILAGFIYAWLRIINSNYYQLYKRYASRPVLG